MSADLVRYKVPVIFQWETLGPRWTYVWIREGTSDLDVLNEIVEQDVYHLRGMELATENEIVTRDGTGRTRHTYVPPPLIVDLGANTGIFAVLAAAQFPTARLICVEPEPDNLDVLEKNVTPLGLRAEVWAGAVGAHTGTVLLRGDTAQAHVAPLNQSPEGGQIVSQVPLTTIISEAAVALLKIDVEGAEYDIIDACPPGLLARVDRIAMEFHGTREAPWIDDAPRRFGQMVAKLQETHSCQIIGTPQTGGMIWAHRNG